MNSVDINAKKKKYITSTQGLKTNFFSSTSEYVAQFIIEKIISYVATSSLNDKIEQAIPDYCFNKLKKTIQTYTEIQFIAYDRDDIETKEQSSVSAKSEAPKFEFPNEDSKISEVKNINQSQEVKEQSISKIFVDKKDEPVKEKEESKEGEKKEEIKESEKKEEIREAEKKDEIIEENPSIELNISHHKHHNHEHIFYDTAYEGENDWNILAQPRPVEIDRDASNIIKTTKVDMPEPIIEVPQEHNKRKKTYLMNIGSTKKKDKQEAPKKKIYYEYPSYDIAKEKLGDIPELENIEQLREERQKEIKQKEIEYRLRLKAQQEKAEKENEKAKKKKDLDKRNITVDANGNIVAINPLNPETLQNEFTGASSKSKELGIIEAPLSPVEKAIAEGKRGSIKIEKNPYTDGSPVTNRGAKVKDGIIQNLKDLLVKSKGKGIFHPSPPLLRPKQVQSSQQQNQDQEEKKDMKKRIGTREIIPSGSNFDRIKLEVGVSLLEETKYKSGGKDFFRKYHRYSIENYQKELGISTKVPTKVEKIKKEPDTKGDKPHEEVQINQEEFPNPEPSSTNDTLHIKTKNLKYIVDQLDLISEEEENRLEHQVEFNHTKPENLFHREGGGYTDTNYTEMNVFAKTLTATSDWGKPNMKFKTPHQTGRKFFKPRLKELKREVSGVGPNKFGGPRRRLISNEVPKNPMSSTTTSNFFRAKKKVAPLRNRGEEIIDTLEKLDQKEENFGKTTSRGFGNFAKTTTQNFKKKKK